MITIYPPLCGTAGTGTGLSVVGEPCYGHAVHIRVIKGFRVCESVKLLEGDAVL